MNKVILIGNLGRDPELKYLDSGTAVCKLALATNRKYKGKDGEWTDDTQWHNITVWGKQGENCKEYLSKGRQVALEGRIQTRTYEKDGEKRYATDIVAEKVHFLSGRQNTNAAVKDENVEAIKEQFDAEVTNFNTNDDIPF